MPESAATEHFFEDFQVGQKFHSGTAPPITPERIASFAAEFDPQAFHLGDGAAAQASLWGGQVASGWLTAAMTMRLMVESDVKPAGGMIGAGVEDLRWPNPTRPGDVLSVEIEVLETRASRSRPELGVVKVRATTRNQAGVILQLSIPVMLVRRRGGVGSP